MSLSKPQAIRELDALRKDLLCRAAKAEGVCISRQDMLGRKAHEEAVALRRQHSALTRAIQALRREVASRSSESGRREG